MHPLKVTRNMHSNTSQDNLCKPLFVCLSGWVYACACVCVDVCDTSPARVFERKSCVTICRRLPPQHHARLKLIVKCLLLAIAWAEGAQGHSQGLATISDGLGGVSQHSCYTAYSESQAHLCCCKTSPQLPLMPERVPPSG